MSILSRIHELIKYDVLLEPPTVQKVVLISNLNELQPIIKVFSTISAKIHQSNISLKVQKDKKIKNLVNQTQNSLHE